MVKPVFLIRDPIPVFESWKNAGGTNIDSTIASFKSLFRMQDEAQEESCWLVYEKLVRYKDDEIERICKHWGIAYSPDILELEIEFDSFIFNGKREKRIYQEKKPLGLFNTVEAHSTVKADIPSREILSNSEKYELETKLGMMYLSCWTPQVQAMREALQKKGWFGFDLDDTLHEFRKSSKLAIDETLKVISENCQVPIQDLQETYLKVLADKTSSAFVEGKTSHEYREERFRAVLHYFSRDFSEKDMQRYLVTYEETLTKALELKCGALDLLETLRALGKKIAVITEGPQDAQERTMRALGLVDKADFLATTSAFGVSKTTGLFERVMDHLKISPADMVFVGDNEQRDMLPATRLGIYGIHYAEKENFSLDVYPAKINTLKKLQYILTGGHLRAARLPTKST
jgi:HAD superfamily hydrolase (TIGR01549 family)